ncbi:MAG: domain containing protein [Thermoleophilia bacterium]|nr:domain containing protein [Thermoleophilia bacterium]
MNVQDTLVRDVMHKGCTCVKHDATLVEAAKQMSEECVGALPICGPDDKLIGMLTDRDIVVHCIAADKDPSTCTAGELASGRVIWVNEDAPIQEALDEMETHLIRRIPVIDSERQLCGIIAQADIAMHLDGAKTAELVEVISKAEPRQSLAF